MKRPTRVHKNQRPTPASRTFIVPAEPKQPKRIYKPTLDELRKRTQIKI